MKTLGYLKNQWSAEAILYLASARARCTTRPVFPVDGGLPEAFLR
jgi:hypothetical protein